MLIDQTYLFLAVSTALIMIEPFVPGNLTYSSFGGTDWGYRVPPAVRRFPSASDPRP